MSYYLNITLVDIAVLFIDVIVILGYIIYSSLHYNNPKICNEIIKTKDDLRVWRLGFYSGVINGWLTSYFTVVLSSPLKFMFHAFFVLSTMVALRISLPAWICKKRKLSLVCACDIYEYNDFELMVILAIAGTVAFPLLSEERPAVALLGYLISVAIFMFVFKPKKVVEKLKYPRELEIKSIDDLQLFLMTDPSRRKLITLLRAECDFCKLQAEELSHVEDLHSFLRVIDITDEEKVDRFLLEFLNLEEPEEIKVPTSLIIEHGMSFDRKDGVMTRDEIVATLYNGMTF